MKERGRKPNWHCMYRRDNNNKKNAETRTLMVMTIFVELGYVTASGIQHSTNSIKIPHTKNQSISAHSHSNHHDNCEQANSSQCPSRLLSTVNKSKCNIGSAQNLAGIRMELWQHYDTWYISACSVSTGYTYLE